MSVPPFKKFFYPVLKNSESEFNVSMMSELCARELNLSENDKREKTKKGTRCTYVDRTDWAVYYLYRATLLQRVRRGIYTILQNGKNCLTNL